ncbi:uncharacterized protein BP5553_02477 [Venustampulla echinocandica]|uniref:Uncharacterized protein n=1 Tax=Venustampulla echinocandica TaxID=2656787 RepID=A0A370U404_9HELO|nr:uncharacterized protein BP5553_02477 [Venustampulla echinocandica]RDL42498.1 hypothetical protein BP5553_02477 [Venustampulla echinocandica]
MSDPPNSDQHLLDRLNALKKSSVQLDSSNSTFNPPTPKQATPEIDLSARLRNLRNGSLSPSSSPIPTTKPTNTTYAEPSFSQYEDIDPLRNPVDTDDQTLEELLADLGPEDQWTLDPDDPKDVQKLLDEAKSALPRDEVVGDPVTRTREETEDGAENKGKNLLTRDLDMSVFSVDDDEAASGERARAAGLEDESREVQDIVARLLDEVNLERGNDELEGEDTPKEAVEKSAKNVGNEDKEGRALSLPSAPSSLPSPPPSATEPPGPERSRKSLDFESDIAARMAALHGPGSSSSADPLGLPSAPTFAPVAKPTKSKQYADEEIDSWCIICQDDATVECQGCDSDLYCARCWKEGHVGPDAAFEMRRHKWSMFKKPN